MNLENAEKIDGWMTTKELEWIANIARDQKLILEIGCYKGRSTTCWVENSSATIHCVDIWDKSHYKQQGDHDESAEEIFDKNMASFIREGRVIKNKISFADYEAPCQFDLIFIDGDHSYDHVKHDVEKALKLLKPGGILCGHDFGKPYAIGVDRVVKQLGNFGICDTIWWIHPDMTLPKSKATKVLVGVSTQEMARDAIFYDYLSQLIKPEGTLEIKIHGQSPARARNVIIDTAIENDCTHILFIDDDVMVPSDIITKLLAHDKDIVTGYYLMRSFPHQGIIFDVSLPDGKCKWHSPSDSESGLIPIVNCGLGAVLIRTKVFEKLEKPYVRLGQCEADHWCDDIDFFNRARAAGFELWCDLSVCCGHASRIIVYPRHDGTKWFVDYDSNGISKVSFEAVRYEVPNRTNE